MSDTLPNSWRKVRLADAANWLSGGTPSTTIPEYWGGSIPWISAASLTSFYIMDSDRRITELGARNGTRVVEPGAVLFVVRGMSLKSEFRIGIAKRRVSFGQDCKALIAKPGIHPLFLAYAIRARTREILAMVDEAGHGTGRLPTDRISGMEIAVPLEEAEQQAIANLLGVLDDKIELNRRMSETLEATVRAIFKSWFVDFDPVQAKTNGRPPPGVDVQTSALFPDSLNDSLLGEIPKGWRVGLVRDIVVLSRQTLNPTESSTEVFDHYSIPAFDEGRVPAEEQGLGIRSNKLVVTPQMVLVSKLNPRITRVWLPFPIPNRRSIASTEFLAMIPRSGLSRAYLYSLFSSDEFMGRFVGLVTGTSGSHQRVKPEDFLEMPIVLPEPKVIKVFSGLTEPIIAKLAGNVRESLALAKTRDELLPRLISGELRVTAAEEGL
jgi:type I restriction enzyme, S subunit